MMSFVNYGEVSDQEFLNSMHRELKPYWRAGYINTPNENVKLRVDPATGEPLWNMYWRNMVERQNIWWKRVMEGAPKPWTEEPIMGTFHFTNVDRRLDRVTVYYIDKLLGEFKRTCKSNDDYEAKKYLILNTFIYRLFVRPDTWESMGYIHPDTAAEDWEKAKAGVRKRREDGHTIFTDAYYVNDLKSANPNTETNSNKTENAICLIQYIIDNLDDIAGYILDPNNTMEAIVHYCTRIPAVGLFNSYEAMLDIGMVTEFTGIPFVEWTADYYTNVGPGCKKGIDYVFESKGGMSDEQIVFFMAAVYKHEFARLGLEYKYQPGVTELDLRCLEGWFCESQKWFNAYFTNIGSDLAKGKRPKKKMKLRTEDVEWLKPRV